MKKIIMLMLAAGITGSVYADGSDDYFRENVQDYLMIHQDALSASIETGISNAGSALVETVPNSDSDAAKKHGSKLK